MTFENIEELADVLSRSPLTRIDVRGEDWQITLERPTVEAPAAAAPPIRPQQPADLAVMEDAGATEGGVRVEAPIVGVFHEAPTPVKVGQAVHVGDALGSIEALALRNDVRAPMEGFVTAIHVEDGQPVEYGQPLYTLEEALS